MPKKNKRKKSVRAMMIDRAQKKSGRKYMNTNPELAFGEWATEHGYKADNMIINNKKVTVPCIDDWGKQWDLEPDFRLIDVVFKRNPFVQIDGWRYHYFRASQEKRDAWRDSMLFGAKDGGQSIHIDTRWLESKKNRNALVPKFEEAKTILLGNPATKAHYIYY